MSDTITRRDAFHVLDNCRFASEKEKKYAYSLMEQVASADAKDTNDTISRQAAIDAVRHAWAKGLEPSQYIEELPSAQPKRTEKRTETHSCDYISREAAIDAINHICPVDTEYDCTLLDRVDVRCVLSDLPSAQPDLSGYSDKLWRNAYEKGKAEGKAEIITKMLSHMQEGAQDEPDK